MPRAKHSWDETQDTTGFRTGGFAVVHRNTCNNPKWGTTWASASFFALSFAAFVTSSSPRLPLKACVAVTSIFSSVNRSPIQL